jgi:Flp pilus assembly protein TadD
MPMVKSHYLDYKLFAAAPRKNTQAAMSFLALLFLLMLGACLPPPSPPVLPTLIPDPQALIQQQRARGNLTTAAYYVHQLAQATGWTPAVHRLAGDLWRDMGDVARAVPHYAAAAENTTDAVLLSQLAGHYLMLDQPAAALDTLRHGLRLNPEDRWANLQISLILIAPDPTQAEPYLLKAMRADGDDGALARQLLPIVQQYRHDPLLGLRVGAVLAQNRRWQAAEWAFDTAAATQYPLPEAMAYTALMRAFQGKDGSAWMRQAVTLAPENATIRLIDGIHRRMLSDYAGSEQALLYALALEPENPIIHVELGLTNRAIGRLREASYWLQSAVQMSGNDPALQTLLLNFYADSAGVLPDTALLLLAGQLQTQPDNPELLSAYGWALHLTGDSFAGLEQIEKALALDPTNPRILFDKARVLLELQRLEPAQRLLEQVADSDSPYAEMASAILAGLR